MDWFFITLCTEPRLRGAHNALHQSSPPASHNSNAAVVHSIPLRGYVRPRHFSEEQSLCDAFLPPLATHLCPTSLPLVLTLRKLPVAVLVIPRTSMPSSSSSSGGGPRAGGPAAPGLALEPP